MRALIMAGGAGSRLGQGEKPLTLVRGVPMLSYIIKAFHDAGCEPVVAVSAKTPMTANWCRAHGLTIVRTNGCGYIDDMIYAVRQLEEKQPLIVTVSDIPCITPAVVTAVLRPYENCGKDALSTWVPAYRVKSSRGGMPYHEKIRGIESCPAGINILRGDIIDAVQEEFPLLLDEPRLGLNVNTPEDLARAETFLLTVTTDCTR
jgi:adenosylcobinamide-phosphate guanylyltransferase